MARQIYVNLPIKNMERSKAFFAALGFSFNPQFTNEQGACMVIAEGSSYAMLLVEPFFQTFTPKKICDASRNTEVLVAISLDNREAVERIVAQAIAAGAKTPNPPRDYGFMYQHGFEDLDGHLWEFFYMDAQADPS
jgi:predicted lactoylglutathione lyase